MPDPLFQGWDGPLRTLGVGLLAYLGLVALIRVSGKRTLSKLNAFDLVVTVAIGSTLATILLNRQIPLVEGLVAFAVLIGAQHVVALASTRSEAVRGVVKSQPRLLAWKGELDRSAMADERVAEVEIAAAVRASGVADLTEVDAVVLETDGSLSIVRSEGPLLRHVRGAAERLDRPQV